MNFISFPYIASIDEYGKFTTEQKYQYQLRWIYYFITAHSRVKYIDNITYSFNQIQELKNQYTITNI